MKTRIKKVIKQLHFQHNSNTFLFFSRFGRLVEVSTLDSFGAVKAIEALR